MAIFNINVTLDPTLAALGALDATAGLVEQTGVDAFTKRAIGVGTAASVLTRADGDGRYDAAGAASAAQAAAIAAAAADATTKANAAQAAAIAASQPVDSDLTAIAALTTTAFGRSLLELANAAAGRTAFGLGTAALNNTVDFDPAGSAAAAQAASQPVDSDLTAIAALSTTAYGRAFLALADATAARAAIGVTATGADTAYAFRANDLSDLASKPTALVNLGLTGPQFLATVQWAPPSGVSAVTVIGSGGVLYAYLGKALKAVAIAGTANVVYRVTTATVGAITWAEVALFKGPVVLNANASLTLVGFGDVSGVVTSTGIKNSLITMSAAIAYGDDLWVAFGGVAATTQWQVRGAIINDIQSGVGQSSAVRPSTTATAVATTIQGATGVPPWMAVYLN